MLILSLGTQKTEILFPDISRMVQIPTDFDREGRIGRDWDDNSYLAVLGPDDRGDYMVFSVDKSTWDMSANKGKNFVDLFQENRDIAIYRRHLTVLYNSHVKGEDPFAKMEEIFERVEKARDHINEFKKRFGLE